MRTCHQSRSGSYLDPRRQPLFSIRTISFASGNDRDWRLFKRSAVVNRAQLPAHGYPIALLDPESRPHLARPVISNRQSHSFGSVLNFSSQRSSAGFPPARIDMAASQCVHDGRTEIANDESPRSPDQKRDQEKSEPKRDATPYTWYRPEAAKRQDRKEQGDSGTQHS